MLGAGYTGYKLGTVLYKLVHKVQYSIPFLCILCTGYFRVSGLCSWEREDVILVYVAGQLETTRFQRSTTRTRRFLPTGFRVRLGGVQVA